MNKDVISSAGKCIACQKCKNNKYVKYAHAIWVCSFLGVRQAPPEWEFRDIPARMVYGENLRCPVDPALNIRVGLTDSRMRFRNCSRLYLPNIRLQKLTPPETSRHARRSSSEWTLIEGRWIHHMRTPSKSWTDGALFQAQRPGRAQIVSLSRLKPLCEPGVHPVTPLAKLRSRSLHRAVSVESGMMWRHSGDRNHPLYRRQCERPCRCTELPPTHLFFH